MLEQAHHHATVESGIAERARSVDAHLAGVPWRTRKDLMHRHAVEWDGLVAVLSGVKPAYVFDESLGDVVGSLIPGSETDRFAVSSNGWFYDVHAVTAIVRSRGAYFPEMDTRRLDDPGYVRSLVEARTCRTTDEVPRSEVAKTGLLLGFPERSVISFANGEIGVRVPFARHGYHFSAALADLVPFTVRLDTVARRSGMAWIKERQSEAVAHAFRQSLGSLTPSVGIVEDNGGRFIEISGVVEGERVIHQLLHVAPQSGTLGPAAKLVETFGNRANYPAFAVIRNESGEAVAMGTGFESAVDHVRSYAKRGVVPYLQLDETPSAIEARFFTIDPDKLSAWAPESLREAVSVLNGRGASPSGSDGLSMADYLMGRFSSTANFEFPSGCVVSVQ